MDIIKTMKKGSLIVISGPTCAGKGTICKELLKINKNIWPSISYTSRPKRDYETNGKEYYFVTKEEFEEKIKQAVAENIPMESQKLKIGIMGCIVNGPGEMADADYGYVGAGRGRISLYRKKECILKNIPEEEAVDRLLELIKEDAK